MPIVHTNSFEYSVESTDTLERIAARHDSTPSELMKLNKLGSRMVFAGQRLKVPAPKDPPINDATSQPNGLPTVSSTSTGGQWSAEDRIMTLPLKENNQLTATRNPLDYTAPSTTKFYVPSTSVVGGLTHQDPSGIRELPYPSQFGGLEPRLAAGISSLSSPTTSAELELKALNESVEVDSNHERYKKHTQTTSQLSPQEEFDVESLQKFLKLRVKYFTDCEGTITGVLLVTPNCMMFDPDVTHPLVKENGPERYGMIAKLENIISAALYKDISAMESKDAKVQDRAMFQSRDVMRNSNVIGMDNEGNSNNGDDGQPAQCGDSFSSHALSSQSMSDGMLTDGAQVETNNSEFTNRHINLPYKTNNTITPLNDIPEISEQEAEQLQLLITAPPVNPNRRHLSESDLTSPQKPRLASISEGPILQEELDGTSDQGADDRNYLSIDHMDVVVSSRASASAPGSIERLGSKPPSLGELRLSDLRDRAQSETSPPKEKPRILQDQKNVLESNSSAQKPPLAAPKRLNRLRSSLKRSISTSANTVGGAVGGAVGAAKSTATVMGGAARNTATVVGGAVHNTANVMSDAARSTANVVGDAIQTTTKVVADAPKNIASVPKNIVNMSTGLFSLDDESDGSKPSSSNFNILDDWYGDSRQYGMSSLRTEIMLQREKSHLKLEELKAKTEQERKEITKQEGCHFQCATSKEERPELFTPVNEMLPPFLTGAEPINTELPYFLCVRLDRKKRRREHDDPSLDFGDKAKTEYWFTIPKDRAENLYLFFIQWTPEKYGQIDDDVDDQNMFETPENIKPRSDGETYSGFVVIREENDKNLAGENSPFPGNYGYGSSMSLNREWEIVTVEEVKRRLSLLDLDISKMPLPVGSTDSQILNEEHLRQIMHVLPARADGYGWILLYSTSEHGFSLRTLYRQLRQNEYSEISPTLLVVKDNCQNIFGALISCPIKPTEHFLGTGESFLFTFYPEFKDFIWTGENQYFFKGDKSNIAFGGGGGGQPGLWLDGPNSTL